jgi:hypothetical protein
VNEQHASNASSTACADLLPAGESIAIWQLARHWHCHREHIIRLVESGAIRAFDLRGAGSSRSTLRIPRAALVEFLEKRQVIVPPSRDKHARKH